MTPRKYNSIMLIGCGGVGAPLSIMLGNICDELHLVDHDTYERHNIHRQPLAKGAIGSAKVDCLAQALAPWVRAEIIPHHQKFDGDDATAELLLFAEPELVVIAVDNDEARKVIWEYRHNFDILWAANEVWDPQAGLSLKDNPWNPLEAFKPAETTEHPICGQQSIHANCAAASMASFLIMCHLAEDGAQPAFLSKSEGTQLHPIPRDEF